MSEQRGSVAWHPDNVHAEHISGLAVDRMYLCGVLGRNTSR